MAKKATAAELRAFIKEQRKIEADYKSGKSLYRGRDFPDRQGRIVRPTRDNPFPTMPENAGRYGSAQNYTTVIAAAGLLGGLFFLSANITGNAIANLTVNSSSFVGAALLIVGLVAGFFSLNNKKK